MSKIICDVCGTSYPETATQCPICGCVRPTDAVTVNTESASAEVLPKNTYTYVKGGRFSKANVKKRNSANYSAPTESEYEEETAGEKNSPAKAELSIPFFIFFTNILLSNMAEYHVHRI